MSTGRLRDFRRSDLITKLAPVRFDPHAKGRTWDRFLYTVFAGQVDLIRYVQRLVGYSLTGNTSEHVLPFLLGGGANGKSTFVELILSLLGPDYAMKAGPDLLMARRGEAHPTERADLHGKRFVACVETEAGRRLNESLVKELTGGDRVRARRMREDFWEFVPMHHVWLAGNHKPVVHGRDHGIWRRLKLIPFLVTIPPGGQDKRLGEKLKAELPGILNWVVAGCLDWRKNGLNEPDVVRAHTDRYAEEMDEVGRFVTECCEAGPAFIEEGGKLYRKFQEVCPDGDMSNHAFAARLKEKGFVNRDPDSGKEVKTKAGVKAWRGLRLRPVVRSETVG